MTNWRAFAACKNLDPELFYPTSGMVALVPQDPVYDESGFELVVQDDTPPPEPDRVEDTICAGCPVRLPCLDHAMGEMRGIWGGWRAEIRSWVRRSERPCVWCSWPIPKGGPRLFCGWPCLIAAAGATGEERERVDKLLAEMEDTARLRIATSKGRRQTEGTIGA